LKVFQIVFFLVYLLYFVKSWGGSGRTPGKAFLNLRVTDESGAFPISYGRALGRFFAMGINFALWLLPFLIIPFNRSKHGVHDYIGGTAVIKEGPATYWYVPAMLLFFVLIGTGLGSVYYGYKIMAPFMKEMTLLYAAKDGDVAEIKKSLAQGVSVNAHNSKGETPLILAAKNDKVDAVQALLDAGADVNLTDLTNKTAIRYAIAGSYNGIAILLVQHH